MRKTYFLLGFSTLLTIVAWAIPLYIVQGNDAILIGTIKVWKTPYVNLQSISNAVGLKWSVEDGSGVMTNGDDFVNFNVKTHKGTFDALYELDNVASGTNPTWVSLKVVSKLLNLPIVKEGAGYFLLKTKPFVQFNGALMYMDTFTLFFSKKPSTFAIHVEYQKMKTVVTVFPVHVSKDYVSPHSPLVSENVGKYSVTYTIFFPHKVKVVESLGYPSLPVQNAKSLNLSHGITFHTFKIQAKTLIRVYALKIPSGVNTKVVYPIKGVGTLSTLTSMISATSVAAVGWSTKASGFIACKGNLIHACVENGPVLVWNDRKFDIIETSPTIAVNIGEVPFNVDGVNSNNGGVLLYTWRYGQVIPREDRIYYVVKGGKVVSKSYMPKVQKGEYLISIDKEYALFLRSVNVGDNFNLFVSVAGNQLKSYEGVVQGKTLLVSNSKRVPWLPVENLNETNSLMTAGVKDGDLYLVKMASSKKMNFGEIADVLVNMGLSKAMLLASNVNQMIVDGKIVEFERKRLYPVGFGIEIDKTTGGA